MEQSLREDPCHFQFFQAVRLLMVAAQERQAVEIAAQQFLEPPLHEPAELLFRRVIGGGFPRSEEIARALGRREESVSGAIPV